MKKNIDQNFKFVVAGGGTAGWLTALFLNRHFPDSSVTVVQSSDIGILGAGEGTTPHFVEFLDELGIPVSDLVKNCKATIKNGIKFTNWNNDGKSYFHPFTDLENLDSFHLGGLNYTNLPLLALDKISNNQNLDEISFSSVSSELNKVRFVKKENFDSNTNSILHYYNLGQFALHFDAKLLAKFLETEGIKRGIEVVDDLIEDYTTDIAENITNLKFTKTSIDCDFVFDCTGLKRFFIKNYAKDSWNDYSSFLPVDSAIPFFIEQDDSIIEPYTESIAMDYGWVWKIPVQGRYGCGYVFDSSVINSDKAIQEIEQKFNIKLQNKKSFKFTAGYHKSLWNKNCLAVGLSAGFLEPLEATSIWVTIIQLHSFLEHLDGLTHDLDRSKNNYNTKIHKFTENIMSFVHLHYLTERKDTEFWKKFSKDHHPNCMKHFYKLCSNDLPNYDFFGYEHVFKLSSWYSVGAGIKFFDNEIAIRKLAAHTQGINKDAYEKTVLYLRDNITTASIAIEDHTNFLNYLRDK